VSSQRRRTYENDEKKSAKKHLEVALTTSNYGALVEELWQTAGQAANTMHIGPRSARLLRAWIAMA
jgi:hypothetical protein